MFIPHLCHHRDLPDIGACGMCVVEVNGEQVRACATKAEDNLQVISKSAALDHVRAIAMSLMLSAHIDDCNSCPKYLKCEFQSLIQQQGATSNLRRATRGLLQDEHNPLIIRDMERCVACGRCVRVCRELRGVGAITYAADENGRMRITTKGPDLVDSDCRFCGACVEVCPTGALRDKDGVFAERFARGEKLVPCAYECPAHLDIPVYIRFLHRGESEHALEKIMERAPLPRALGAVCMRFCENKCRRQYLDAPVAICSLKRYAAESSDAGWRSTLRPEPLNGRSVAVIGSGPCGLTAAWLLRMKGYSVTIFEKLPEPGGMMRYGMPEYRLAREALKADIDTILSIGVELRCNTEITEQFQLDGFEAVLWCGGADRGMILPLAGADCEGLMAGLDFLRTLRMGERPVIGKNVLVLGGGDVAFDCARSAIRLGAQASVCCLEPFDRMTCSEHERVDGTEEGVRILAGYSFERIISESGKVCGLQVQRVKSFSFENGRLKVESDPDSAEVIRCDTILFAVGQRVSIPEGLGFPVKTRGQADIDECCALTDRFFAAGDAVTGTSSVAQAVGWGQKAAAAIDRYLGGDGLVIPSIAPEQQKDTAIADNCFFHALRRTGDTEQPEWRRQTFLPYESGLCNADAKEQAARCLQCDLRRELHRPRFYNEYAGKGGQTS